MLASSHDNVASLLLSVIHDKRNFTLAFTLENQKQCLCQRRWKKNFAAHRSIFWGDDMVRTRNTRGDVQKKYSSGRRRRAGEQSNVVGVGLGLRQRHLARPTLHSGSSRSTTPVRLWREAHIDS
jgi:hypothetical protein